MAIKSMTGFGRGEACNEHIMISVELSAVNRKQFDCSCSLPRELTSLEVKLQAMIRAKVTRGYVKAVVSITAAPTAVVQADVFDMTTLKKQVGALREAAKMLELTDDLTASSLLRLPDLFRGNTTVLEPETLWPLVAEASSFALDKLVVMREREGAALETDLRQRFARMMEEKDAIAALAPQVPVTYQAVLEKRLGDLLGHTEGVDPLLLAREVAVFADRCDVSEELTRLASHFKQVNVILKAGGACGRTLDFICQELFREINTTGSKANDAEISRRVISFKAALEAAREQVQNIE